MSAIRLANASVRGLANMLSVKGRDLQARGASQDATTSLFRLAEQITTRLDRVRTAEPTRAETEIEIARWSKLMTALAGDPSASFGD
jgi:hypothetical protein